MDRTLTFSEKVISLFSIKSVNNIFIRAKFALVVPPIYARPTYFLIAASNALAPVCGFKLIQKSSLALISSKASSYIKN